MKLYALLGLGVNSKPNKKYLRSARKDFGFSRKELIQFQDEMYSQWDVEKSIHVADTFLNLGASSTITQGHCVDLRIRIYN